jgi:hypothetical protein
VLPGLRRLHIIVSFEYWVDESMLDGWDWDGPKVSRFEETGRIFREMKEFLECVNPGVVATVELNMEDEYRISAFGPYKESRWDPQRRARRWN